MRCDCFLTFAKIYSTCYLSPCQDLITLDASACYSTAISYSSPDVSQQVASLRRWRRPRSRPWRDLAEERAGHRSEP